MASNIYRRRLSVVDIQYAALGSRLSDKNQIIIQHVIEGNGVLDNETLKAVVKQLAQAIPSCRLNLKGHWGFKKWVADGPEPSVRTIYQEWDGHYHEGLSFLDQPFDLFSGPVAEIIQVVSSHKTFLIFRVHHAVMDGVSIQKFILSFFRILREEPIEQCHSQRTVEDLPCWDSIPEERETIQRAVTPLGHKRPTPKHDSERVWHRFSVKANDMLVLSRIIVALSDIAREKEPGHVRINAPVDLRRYLPSEENTAANFVGNVIVDVEEGDSVRSVTKKFNRQYSAISKDLEGAKKLSRIIRWIPFYLLQKLARSISKQHHRKEYYGFSGTVSTLGFVKLEDLSSVHFKATNFFGIPISQLLTPVFVSVTSTDQGSELVLGAPFKMATDNRLIDMAEKLQGKVNMAACN